MDDRDMIRVIYKIKDKDEYYFYDDINFFIESGGLTIKIEVIGFVNQLSKRFHSCNHSAIWEEIAPDYVDALQGESDMPEGNYVVCWYECDDNYDLRQRVDYNISKEQIIQNVIDQKYREGADYYLMNEIKFYAYVLEMKEEPKLKKYRLTYEIVFEAEAEDEDHALELADEMWAEGNFELHPYIEEMED